ncbi:putative N-acetyltransferase YjcF [Frondihabitans sp. 762G35]|uniref:GNAT family N-acetyltransferase n=1 Tax=Frondihabitans sp. 762G35 TaxID=1446794 RepID=UPI000D214989|nr:GNAT family N-acetyltransferase [Frondihabitans sp. 762G35]ARC57698.1 putative N-acetyltransferase YjcF [Frondihabitans sp. 762G35]
MTSIKQPAPTALRVAWDDPRAVALRDVMEVEMSALYADAQGDASPEQRRRIDDALYVDPALVHATVLIVEADGTPIGHAALKDLRGDWEMKRVIVDRSARGRGVGALLMAELERAAREGGARRIILQTGDRQQDAVRLYQRSGYTPIPVYEPYVLAIPFSLCFEKVLDPGAVSA